MGPVNHRDVRRLQDLLAYPRESLDIELKSWLDLSRSEDAANLAKAILALANHGGGHVILGFSQDSGEWVPAHPRPRDLTGYDQDRINGIVHHYADPPFQCEVHHIPHPANRDPFPLVVVPGGHAVPIRAKCDGPDGKHVRRHSYYIRRPGPQSEVPQSGREWDHLIRRCMATDREGLLYAIQAILAGGQPAEKDLPVEDNLQARLSSWADAARSRWEKRLQDELKDEQPSRYVFGTWDVAYGISEVEKTPSLKDLLDILERVQGHETGWPPWWVPTRDTIKPRPYEGLIECWLRDSLFGDGAHSDFWRASPQGMMFLLRGYDEDGTDAHREPGTILDPVTSVWRIGECLLHAARFGQALANESAPILFRVQWRGLSHRAIQWVAGRKFGPHFGNRVCEQDTVGSEVMIRSTAIEGALPELVQTLVSPLCEAFDFYELPPAVVREQLAQMRGRSQTRA